MKYELDRDYETVDFVASTVSLDFDAIKAFLENPEVVSESDGIAKYPLGDVDSRGVRYHLLSREGETEWSACSEVFEPTSVEMWLSCSKEELIETLTKAISEV